MFRRLLCLFIALILLLCGCGQTDEINGATQSTTTTSSAPAAVSSHLNSTTQNRNMCETNPSDGTTTSHDTTISTQHPSSATMQNAATSANSFGTTSTTSATITSTTNGTNTGSTIAFIATVRNDQQMPVVGVTVSIWVSDDVCIGSGVTDSSGKARVSITPSDYTYRVRLSNLPTGYEADAEYRFSTTTVNITIRKAAVQDENDHSRAQYEVGKKMADFSLIDTEGNSYRLSELLQDKQLVVLDFWFTTCSPCKSEFPYFETAVQKYGDKMDLLAVNPINDHDAIVKLRNEFNAHPDTAVSFPMLRDTCKLYQGFDVTAYPTTIFIGADGIILDIHVGAYPSETAFFAAVERYLQ